MKKRIKKLRQELDLTQLEFADRLGVKRGTIANYEIGRNEPVDSVISLICREFNVNEEWLRTGNGNMFIEIPEDDSFSAAAAAVLKDNDILAMEGLKLYYSLRPEEKAAAADYILRLADMIRKRQTIQTGISSIPELTVEDLEAEYKKTISGSAQDTESTALNTIDAKGSDRSAI